MNKVFSTLSTALLAMSAAIAQPINISADTTYTVSASQPVTFQEDISGYYSSNGITATSPNFLFPDNGVVFGEGLNPTGANACHQSITPVYVKPGTPSGVKPALTIYCTNYRFQVAAVLPGSTYSNTPALFYTIDPVAQFLNKSDDPPGTVYGEPELDGNGVQVITFAAFADYEPKHGHTDRIGTMAWFGVVGRGTQALTPGNFTTFSVSYNPRPGDPQTFVWGDGISTLQQIFYMQGVGNEFEPVQTNGVNLGVFAQQ